MNKIKMSWEWICQFKFLIIIFVLSFCSYFFTKHESISFMDSVNIIIAIILGYIAIKADQLTSTDEIRATYLATTTIFNQWYISDIILENKRNKPIAINAIHLMLGYNYAVQLKEYDEPFMLQPLSAIKIKLEPVSLYLINCDKIINLKKEFDKTKSKSLVITSTDKQITVKSFKACPNMVAKMLYEQPFAEIIPHRYYLDNNTNDVMDYNIRFFITLKDSNSPNKNIGKMCIRNDNMLTSYQFPSIKLKQDDLINVEKIENKIREILPDNYKNYIIEVKENKISDKFPNTNELDLKHYNWIQTQIIRVLYKIKLNKELKVKKQK